MAGNPSDMVWLVSLIALLMLAFSFWLGLMFSDRGEKSQCWHHDRATSETWINGTIIDMGSRKQFTCSHCGRMWFT